MVILAVKTHHCSLKIRARYYFELPVDKSRISSFTDRGWNLKWNRFSEYNPNAKDQFTIIKKDHSLISISGVEGEKSCDVFFGKPGVSTYNEDMKLLSEFDQLLLNLGFGENVIWQDRTDTKAISG